MDQTEFISATDKQFCKLMGNIYKPEAKDLIIKMSPNLTKDQLRLLFGNLIYNLNRFEIEPGTNKIGNWYRIDVSTLTMLLELGAEIPKKKLERYFWNDCCKSYDSTIMIYFLDELGVDINSNGSAGLVSATEYQRKSNIDILLERGIKVNEPKVITYVCSNGLVEYIPMLVDHGVNPDQLYQTIITEMSKQSDTHYAYHEDTYHNRKNWINFLRELTKFDINYIKATNEIKIIPKKYYPDDHEDNRSDSEDNRSDSEYNEYIIMADSFEDEEVDDEASNIDYQ